MTTHTVLAARKYLGAIRNPVKQAYGVQYFAFLRGAAEEPNDDGLSAMAAQAVRMQLAQILDVR
jgi:hypothetical protein